MIEGFFENLNFQEIRESIILQANSMLDPERFQFLVTSKLLWDKVWDNPLASIFILLALFGVPYALFKAKKSNTEANERLDLLMDEMKDFEFEKPLIDLQEKFTDTSFDNSSATNYKQKVPESSPENKVPDLSIEEDSVLQDLESASFVKPLTLDQEATDDFLAAGSMDLQLETDDESPGLSPLAEEIIEETETIQPAGPGHLEGEDGDQYFEDLPIREEDRDLVSASEEYFDKTEVNPPDSPVKDEEFASHDRNDLQTRMEQAIKKLRQKYSPLEETERVGAGEINANPVSSAFGVVEKSSFHEETEEDENEDISHLSPASIPPDSLVEGQDNSLKNSHLITHLRSFQENLENHFNSKVHELKTNPDESRETLNSSFEKILQPTEKTSPAPNKTTDKEYQESLESLKFLRDRKKPE